MKDAIQPVAFLFEPSYGYFALRFEAAHADELLAAAEQSWKKISPASPFQYSFLNEDFEKMYNSEKRLGKIFAIFSGLAIIIGCLGLFALTAFTAEQRTKEIGIRKVLGASVGGVVVLITNEFLWLILAALIVATPLTWYLISQWEQNSTLQATINPLRFVIAGIAVLAFAWITIGFLSFRAATANPTSALRTE
jgi:putative ABC transport system permease protein